MKEVVLEYLIPLTVGAGYLAGGFTVTLLLSLAFFGVR